MVGNYFSFKLILFGILLIAVATFLISYETYTGFQGIDIAGISLALAVIGIAFGLAGLIFNKKIS
jgi:hypothetical protein